MKKIEKKKDIKYQDVMDIVIEDYEEALKMLAQI